MAIGQEYYHIASIDTIIKFLYSTIYFEKFSLMARQIDYVLLR